LSHILEGDGDPAPPSEAGPPIGMIAMEVARDEADVTIAARLRVRALVRVLQEILHCGTVGGDADLIFLHNNVFVAAASEPLIGLTDGDIGFDPESLRSRILQFAEARGVA
jgi:hypothetical protein